MATNPRSHAVDPPIEPIRTYFRAWTIREEKKAQGKKSSAVVPPIELILVLDTETTTDPSQRLLFGSARLYKVEESSVEEELELRYEWLFYADDLPERDPDGYQILKTYAADHDLKLFSRDEFVEKILRRAVYKARATLVGFNLPFDLSRLALGWGKSRKDPGFSLRIWARIVNGVLVDHPYRSRIGVQKLAPGRALIRLRRPKEIDPDDQIPEGEFEPDPAYTFPGHFLDLHTLGFALTNRRMTLNQACRAFGADLGKGTVEEHGKITAAYIDYNRRDVEATASLFQKLYTEYRRHPINLPPTAAFSPASIGKTYLKAMGVIPPLEKWADFPPEVLGYSMTAYYGGRAECRIRHVPVPVVTVDFLSMYTTVCSLLGIWDLFTAKRLEIVDATTEVQALLAEVATGGPQVMLDPDRWQGLVGFVQVQPDGDILPVRADYGAGDKDRPQIGINPSVADEPFWYPISDLVSTALLSGQPSQVLQAFNLVPSGKQSGLEPVRFRGEVTIDPVRGDFFRQVIEERKRSQNRSDLSEEERNWWNTGLKTVANATAYGITAEMIRYDGERDRVTVYGLGEPFETGVDHPENPGPFCFPPFAAAITGGARLMLAILERLITDRGGVYATCDTDSMAIAVSEQGGLIPCPGGPERLPDGTEAILALPWAEIEEIIEAFELLHVYDREAVPGPLLELEAENYHPDTGERKQLWCLATSAKRYVLWNEEDGEVKIRKASEHGLGHLLDPTGQGSRPFSEAAWKIVLARHLGTEAPDPDWLDRPAVARLVASTPYLLDLFSSYNQGKVYADQVKPFGFMLSATPKRVAGPLLGVERLHLIAPHETNPARWEEMDWTDIYKGKQYKIGTTIDPADPNTVPVQTLRDVIETWATNPELKSLGPDGQVCDRETRGLLQRRPVRTTRQLVTLIGKESNHLEEAQVGIYGRDEILNEYADPDRDPWTHLVLPAIEILGAPVVAERAGLNRRTVNRAVRGTVARRKTRNRIAGAVKELIVGQGHGLYSKGTPVDQMLMAFLERTADPKCRECGSPLDGRRRGTRFCDDRCRMRYRRQIQRGRLG